MDCIWGNPVSALRVGGNGPWKTVDCTPNPEVALNLVCLATCVKNNNNNNNRIMQAGQLYSLHFIFVLNVLIKTIIDVLES